MILAFDIGTSAAKGALINRQGVIVAAGTVAYGTHHGPGGQVEQDPEDWWQAVRRICHGFWAAGHGPSDVQAVALTGQMQDVILVDGTGQALGPALLYADTRADAESAEIRRLLTDRGMAADDVAGLDAAAPLAKLAWLQAHDPRQLAEARGVLFNAKDYVLARLSGALATDATTAGTTGCYSLAAGAWRRDWLEAISLPAGLLPLIASASAMAGLVSAAADQATGIPAGTPVHGGMGDAAAATLAAGLTVPGTAYMYLGTTAWAAALVQGAPVDSGGLRHLPFITPGQVIRAAPILNAGSAHHWIMDLLGMGGQPDASGVRDYARFEHLLRSTPGRSDGVVFLPYLNGERCPVQEQRAMGTFIHLGPTTTAGELAWAVMEGICFALRQVFEALGGPAGTLRLVGGMTRGALFPRLVEDVLGVAVEVGALPEASGALAAAVPVAVNLGWYDGVEQAVRAWFPRSESPPPSAPGSGNHYERLYQIYRQIYPLIAQVE